MNSVKIIHDMELFEALLEKSKWIDPNVRKGSMFGCPAVFHRRRMAICVYGNILGLKVPEHIATTHIESGSAVPFQPYGKGRMREWIAIEGGAGAINSHVELITTAIAYAENNN